MSAIRVRVAQYLLLTLGVSGIAMGQTPTPMIASLRPNQALQWRRVSPSVEKPDGPVMYQLLFGPAGTPGTIPVFDTNARHLSNSPITVSGGNVVIGGSSGLRINAATGIITFASGQPGTAGGTVTSVATGTGLTGGPITTTGTISIATGGVTTAQLAAGAVLAGNISGGQVVKNLNGLTDNVTLAAGTGVSITPSGQTLTIANSAMAASVPDKGGFWAYFVNFPPGTGGNQSFATNIADVILFSLPAAYKVSNITVPVNVAGGPGSHCDTGFYDAAGNLLVHTGSFDCSTTGYKKVPVTTPTVIGPGAVYEAYCTDSTVVQILAITTVTATNLAERTAEPGSFGRAGNPCVAGVLPTTLGTVSVYEVTVPILYVSP